MYESSCVPRFPYFSPLEFPGNPGRPLRPSSIDAVQRPGDVLGPVHGVRVAANGRDSGERGGAEDALICVSVLLTVCCLLRKW